MKTSDPKNLVEAIIRACESVESVRLMEVCGTHTVSLFRSGVRSVLPPQVRLVSGPGCPVCVTSQGYIDAVLEMSTRPGVTICTYGDMVRVPGNRGSLESHRARGARVEVCYSIQEALRRAETHPGEEVVFAAVGFETTAPAAALAVLEADRMGLKNFTILNGHKRVMPALRALVGRDDTALDGFLLPGHVSVILGSEAYRDLVDRHGKACVVAGFEVEQLLLAVLGLVNQVAVGTPRLENVYGVAVRAGGNPQALACLDRVFEPVDAVWRAMGTIPESGLGLRGRYERFDAAKRFDLATEDDTQPPGCRCGEVIQGVAEPRDCTLFGEACTFEHPVGPCMVSSEGTCAAWYRYGGGH